jgi:hypothetical protein
MDENDLAQSLNTIRISVKGVVMFLKKSQGLLLPLLLLLLYGAQRPVLGWTFGIHADIHLDAEQASLGNTPGLSRPYAQESFKRFKDNGCKLVLFPGDMLGAHYINPKFSAPYKAKYPNLSNEQLIRQCGPIDYTYFKSLCVPFGFTPIFCLGDHELNDDSWAMDSAICNLITPFKLNFKETVMFDSLNHERYTGTIGNVPQRPLGTPYEGSSFAFIHENIMFVTVDEFRYDGPGIQLGPITTSHQCVIGDVNAQHLEWLNNVLAAGRAQQGVDFIIVQGHLPIIRPVRGINTSLMLMDDKEKAALWKVMSDNKVDIYLAGEIHLPTCSRPKNSSVIQLVSGHASGHLIGTVTGNQLKLEMFKANKSEGVLELQRNGQTRLVQGSGLLDPIDVEGLAIHYSFDKTGSEQSYANSGLLGYYYAAHHSAGVEQTTGILGKAIVLGKTDAATYTQSREWSPISEDMGRTVAAWVKTTSTARNTVSMLCNVSSGNFTLVVDNGIVKLSDAQGKELVAKNTPINNGEWHHIAVTNVGGANAKFENTLFFVDGVEVQKQTPNFTRELSTNKWGLVIVGTTASGGNLSIKDFAHPFKGSIDDFAVWSSALSQPMVKVLHQAALKNNFNYNAMVMDSLFHLYRWKTYGTVAGKSWNHVTNLSGESGTIIEQNGTISIKLDAQGGGLQSGSVAASRTPRQSTMVQPRAILKHSTVLISNLAEAGPITVQLYGLNGQRALVSDASAQSHQGTLRIPLSAPLSKGTYLVRIQTGQSQHTLRIANQ